MNATESATSGTASVAGHSIGFAVSVLIYFAIFAVVGLLFRAADRAFRGWLDRRQQNR